jgi:hypothetical protein
MKPAAPGVQRCQDRPSLCIGSKRARYHHYIPISTTKLSAASLCMLQNDSAATRIHKGSWGSKSSNGDPAPQLSEEHDKHLITSKPSTPITSQADEPHLVALQRRQFNTAERAGWGLLYTTNSAPQCSIVQKDAAAGSSLVPTAFPCHAMRLFLSALAGAAGPPRMPKKTRAWPADKTRVWPV